MLLSLSSKYASVVWQNGLALRDTMPRILALVSVQVTNSSPIVVGEPPAIAMKVIETPVLGIESSRFRIVWRIWRLTAGSPLPIRYRQAKKEYLLVKALVDSLSLTRLRPMGFCMCMRSLSAM